MTCLFVLAVCKTAVQIILSVNFFYKQGRPTEVITGACDIIFFSNSKGVLTEVGSIIGKFTSVFVKFCFVLLWRPMKVV